MSKKIFLLGLAGFFAVVFLGCESMEKKNDPASSAPIMLAPSPIPRFTDVPAPVGFKLLPKYSYTFENAGVRVGVLKYQGKASPDSVVSFYKEQMPLYNWNLLNIVEYGDRLMNFERENETCVVGLVTRGGTVTITLSIGPKPQIIKKPLKPSK